MFRCLFGLALAAFLVPPAPAADTPAKERSEAVDKVQKSAKVVTEVMRADDKAIPRDLLKDAECVAVFPNVIKGAFILGGSGGSGCAVCRNAQTGRFYDTPVFLKIGGGSVGFQIGGSSTDFILMGVNRDSQESLAKGEFQLGADASVAAGPIGRSAKAGTDWKLDSQFLSYSRSKGAFAGVALDGSKVKVDKDRNAAVYGDGASAMDIMSGRAKADPSVAKQMAALSATLGRYTAPMPDRRKQ
jgi:lipid-binding SYLF domain-containing protein